MLLFIDESGQDHKHMPCEVLAGVAVAEENYWNMIRAIRGAEQKHFGGYLRDLRTTEVKARRLLKRKCFRLADQNYRIESDELPRLANQCLKKGLAARNGTGGNITAKELTGYSRSVLNFVNEVLDIAASHDVKIFASVVDAQTARQKQNMLQKDFVFLFERYFYFLKEVRGLVVFDELEKSQAQRLIQQMASYFLGTRNGQFRSSRIIPEPFFVDSALTTGIFLADLAAYVIGWSWRLKRMPQEARDELKPFANKLHDMQFIGEKPKRDGTGHWILYSIKYIEDEALKEDTDELASL